MIAILKLHWTLKYRKLNGCWIRVWEGGEHAEQ